MKSARPMVTARHLRFLLFAVPFLIAVGAVGPRGCPIDVQCGDVLALDYGQYRLNGDLVCGSPAPGSNAAVAITGEGVHFNLKGYTITRDNYWGQFLEEGIAVSGANAHIHNGSIVDINCPRDFTRDNYCAAIRLVEAPGTRINGMSLHNNTVGIQLGGSDNANGARIHGNDITGNLRRGIGFFGTAEAVMITGNDLSDSSGSGLTNEIGGHGYIGSSDGVSLIGNVANNSARSGIFLWGREDFPAAERNTIRDNTTLDNGNAGIILQGVTEADRPSDNLIQSNTSFGNAIGDLREVFAGTPATDCLNTWIDNDFDLAEPDCIE